MKRIVLILSLLFAGLGAALPFTVNSQPDGFSIYPGFGDPLAGAGGYRNTRGKTLQSSIPATPASKLVLITVGQSNAESAASGTYATTQAESKNFNIYDGGTYNCANPVVGATLDPSGLAPQGNSVNCQITDSLITNGVYTGVIVVPTAIGGKVCADFVGGELQQRIVATMNRLKAAKLTPLTGFAGDLRILLHLGESDGANGTPRNQLAQCLRDFAALYVANGSGDARFFIPQSESYIAGATHANVIGAQSDAVASGCATCRAGANWDSLTGLTNRQADLTHWNETGAIAASALDVTILTNCKNTSC